MCFHCNKPRCIFSHEVNTEYFEAAKILRRTMESISGYSCGDLIFNDDDDPVSEVLAQRQNLTCKSKVEIAYYNVEGRKFETVPVCIYCGEKGSSDILLQQ